MQAEGSRLDNLKIMDIYKARVKRNKLAQELPDNGKLSVLEHWMDFALIVEEKQCVVVFVQRCAAATAN